MSDDSESSSAVLAPAPELLAATADLCAHLQAISTAQPPSTIDPALAERRRYIRMLHELCVFLKRVWIDGGRALPDKQILALCAALDQLGDGVVHPVLQPPATRRAGVKLDRVEIWDGRKWVCVALECYVKAGKSKSNAAAIIAGKNPGLKAFIRAGTGKDRDGLAKAILSWDRAFHDGTANELVQSWWGEARQLATEPPATSAEEWLDRARRFLALANKTATTMIPTATRTNRAD